DDPCKSRPGQARLGLSAAGSPRRWRSPPKGGHRKSSSLIAGRESHPTIPAMSTAGPASAPDALAVLTSGGLDSAILLGEAMHEHAVVHPLYVRHGLCWEAAELQHLRRFLEVVHCPALRPLAVLDMPVADLYGKHWSITGSGVPDADTPD